MFHSETVERSIMPTSVDSSKPPVDDDELLEKAADEMGAAALVAVGILEADASESAAGLATTEKEILRLAELLYTSTSISLDAPIRTDGDEDGYYEILENESSSNPGVEAMVSERAALVRELVQYGEHRKWVGGSFSTNERKVVSMRFGIDDGNSIELGKWRLF